MVNDTNRLFRGSEGSDVSYSVLSSAEDNVIEEETIPTAEDPEQVRFNLLVEIIQSAPFSDKWNNLGRKPPLSDEDSKIMHLPLRLKLAEYLFSYYRAGCGLPGVLSLIDGAILNEPMSLDVFIVAIVFGFAVPPGVMLWRDIFHSEEKESIKIARTAACLEASKTLSEKLLPARLDVIDKELKKYRRLIEKPTPEQVGELAVKINYTGHDIGVANSGIKEQYLEIERQVFDCTERYFPKPKGIEHTDDNSDSDTVSVHSYSEIARPPSTKEILAEKLYMCFNSCKMCVSNCWPKFLPSPAVAGATFGTFFATGGAYGAAMALMSKIKNNSSTQWFTLNSALIFSFVEVILTTSAGFLTKATTQRKTAAGDKFTSALHEFNQLNAMYKNLALHESNLRAVNQALLVLSANESVRMEMEAEMQQAGASATSSSRAVFS